ncbi:hypothetical protein CHU98_g9053 [Xylaria longipes]|nr:hypothetical protein CHU98_g9053 [Xylaria longipes]
MQSVHWNKDRAWSWTQRANRRAHIESRPDRWPISVGYRTLQHGVALYGLLHGLVDLADLAASLGPAQVVTSDYVLSRLFKPRMEMISAAGY